MKQLKEGCKKTLQAFALGIVACLVFKGGELYNYYNTRQIAIDNECAYYDIKTGKFRWGDIPYIPTMPLGMPVEDLDTSQVTPIKKNSNGK